ncbi:MAG TPA: RNA polymerase sigma factor [Caulobacteraceae bacterium]
MTAQAILQQYGDELALAAAVARREPDAVRRLTRENNQRLYRAAWSILKDRAEAEEAVQEGYLKAFRGIGGFAGGSSLSTWLTRIVVNEALERRRAAERRARLLDENSVAVLDRYREKLTGGSARPSPEAALIRAEAARLLQRAVERLPDAFRPVFVLREIEGLSVEETAEALGIAPETVKTRLFRARKRLREELDPELRGVLAETAAFAGADCEAMTARVLAAWSGEAAASQPEAGSP